MNRKQQLLEDLESKLDELHKKYVNEFEHLDYYKRRSLNEEIVKTKKEIEKLRGK